MTEANIQIILRRMFKGVTKQWYDVIYHDDHKQDLINIITLLSTENDITPGWDDVLSFAKFSFKKIRGIIVGQDPYPKRGDAHGLAFSSKAAVCPMSVSRVFGALQESKLIPNKPATWDLTQWSRQGLILMNASWTTKINVPNAHKNIWDAYTTKVFKMLAKMSPQPLIWMLWGSDARVKCAHIETPHERLEWYHPAATVAGVPFKLCYHFRYFSTKHPDFIWSLEPIVSRFYTDGSCIGNGKPDATGSWGVVCTKGPLKDKSWGDKLDAKTTIISENKELVVAPTNIRGEGFAIIHALKLVIGTGLMGTHTICTDSELWIKMLTEYIPSWIEKKISFEARKNSDISKQLWTLWNIAYKLGCQLQYVQAHHDYKPTSDTLDDWNGNRMAEDIAKENCPKRVSS